MCRTPDDDILVSHLEANVQWQRLAPLGIARLGGLGVQLAEHADRDRVGGDAERIRLTVECDMQGQPPVLVQVRLREGAAVAAVEQRQRDLCVTALQSIPQLEPRRARAFLVGERALRRLPLRLAKLSFGDEATHPRPVRRRGAPRHVYDDGSELPVRAGC